MDRRTDPRATCGRACIHKYYDSHRIVNCDWVVKGGGVIKGVVKGGMVKGGVVKGCGKILTEEFNIKEYSRTG